VSVFPAQKPRCIFVACLALSVFGTFTFAAADLPALDFWKSSPITGGSLTSGIADYTIDCLAEYTAKIRGCSSLPSRKSTHIVIPFVTLFTGITALFSVIKITKLINTLNNKNTILLKLRI
jgi:hypothetical protein